MQNSHLHVEDSESSSVVKALSCVIRCGDDLDASGVDTTPVTVPVSSPDKDIRAEANQVFLYLFVQVICD